MGRSDRHPELPPAPRPVDAPAQLRSPAYARLLLLAAIIGVPISATAYFFLQLVDAMQGWVFVSLPRALGFAATPMWWPLPVLGFAGVLVGLAIRHFPGGAGHSPADGFAARGRRRRPSSPVCCSRRSRACLLRPADLARLHVEQQAIGRNRYRLPMRRRSPNQHDRRRSVRVVPGVHPYPVSTKEAPAMTSPVTRLTENLAWETRSVTEPPPPGTVATVAGIGVDARRVYLTHVVTNPQVPAVAPVARLVVLDADTLQTLREVSLTGTPRAVAVSSSAGQPGRILVGGLGSQNRQVRAFDPVTFNSPLVVELDGQPTRIVASAARRRVYVTVESSGSMFVLDQNGSMLTQVAVGLGASGVAVDDNRIYVSRGNNLVALDADTNAVLQTVSITPTTTGTRDVATLPGARRIFVTNSSTPSLTVLDRDTFGVLAQIPLPAAPSHLAADPDGNRVFAATPAGIYVIDGVQHRVAAVLSPDRPAVGVAFSQQAGRLAWGDPTGGRASIATQPAASPFDHHILRPDDLLALGFTLHNLRLVTDGSGPRLVREVAGQPAFLAVHFPAQSIAERSFTPMTTVMAPIAAILAGRSRVVFRLPDTLTALPFTAKDLLDWTRLQPSLVPVALPPGTPLPSPTPLLAEPTDTQTAIELPYRLVLSPDRTSVWSHATAPVTHDGRAELWHTRLRQPDTPADPRVRAVWTPDLRLPPPPGHADPLPVTFPDRAKIVRLSADWTGQVGGTPYTPLPVVADELMLTALGGFLRVRGNWPAPAPQGLDITAWRHTSTLGRDQKVTVVRRGALFPWGHQAVETTVTEREVTSAGSGPVAALRRRTFIHVTEPERSYPAAQFTNRGRELPFASGVRLLTTVTPALAAGGQIAGAPGAHWVLTTDPDFAFDISAQDPTGRRVTWSAQLIFVPEPLLTQQAAMGAVAVAFGTDNRRRIEITAQPVALAAPSGQAAAGAAAAGPTETDLSLTVERLDFAVQQAVGSVTSYLPRLERAAARIPVVEQMLGVAGAFDIELYQEYLRHGLTSPQNAAAVFARLTASTLPTLDLPVETAGGLAAAAFQVSGLSERLGPVVGDLAGLATGTFDARSLAALGGSKLLGTISLLELIETVTGVSEFERQLPALGTEIERDAAGVPTAVVNRLRWSPRIKSVGPFVANPGAELVIDTFFRQEVAGGPPDYRITGRLTNFAVNFAGVLTVSFAELTFTSLAGRKPALDPLLAVPPVTFDGPLAFLDELRRKIPFDGFSDPPALDVSQRGIDVSYSLGLPPLSFGAFNLENITLGAGLFLPFIDAPAALRFNFAERNSPFQLTVLALGGGGFFALHLELGRIVLIEASLEFGAAAAVNLGVAAGRVYILGGVYFALKPAMDGAAGGGAEVELTGYLRAGGELRVLGIISVSVEFSMSLTYRSQTGELRGQATVRVRVRVAFFRKTVHVTLERRFAGPGPSAALAGGQAEVAAGAAPTFGDGFTEADWRRYAAAFA